MGLSFFEKSSRPLALTVTCTLSFGVGLASWPATVTFFSRSTLDLPLTSTLMPVAAAPASGLAACAAPAGSATISAAAVASSVSRVLPRGLIEAALWQMKRLSFTTR